MKRISACCGPRTRPSPVGYCGGGQQRWLRMAHSCSAGPARDVASAKSRATSSSNVGWFWRYTRGSIVVSVRTEFSTPSHVLPRACAYATATSSAARRSSASRRRATRRDDRVEANEHQDPWANMEISEVRIVYDPYHSSSSSAYAGSLDAYVSAIRPQSATSPSGGSDASRSMSEERASYSRSHARDGNYDPYTRISTADRWKSSSTAGSSSSSYSRSASEGASPSSSNSAGPSTIGGAAGAAEVPAPFPRPFTSPPSSAASSGAAVGGTASTTAETAAEARSSGSGWWRIITIFIIMGLQLWDTRRFTEEAKRKKEEEDRAKLNSKATREANGLAPASAAGTKPSNAQIAKPSVDDAAGKAASTPAGDAGGSESSTNSLAVWVSRQKRLNRTRVLQRKLERGLSKNERDAVLKMCAQSTIEGKQARDILALPSTTGATNEPDDQIKEGASVIKQGLQESNQRPISIRKVLAERLGSEVQVRDYSVINTTMLSNTMDATVWVQESRQILQSRTDPSRRVVMDIRTRIVETKEKPAINSEEEGLILVENRRDMLQELLQLMRRRTEQETDSRVATYVDKVDMTFGPSVCLEFEFDNVRIS